LIGSVSDALPTDEERPDQVLLVGVGVLIGAVDGEGAPVGRRVVLGMIVAGAAGVVFGDRIQSAINSALAPLTENDPTGLTSLLPTGGQFRYYSVTGDQPHRSEAAYRLTVGGLVERPATYTLAALRVLPQTQLTKDFQCVTGWRVEDVPWSGVRLSTLLDAANVRPTAHALLLRSFDGTYTESLTLDQARRPDVLVALQMYGKPVTRAHGGPVRLYAAPMYGYKSLKWLDGIEVVPEVVPGYWERLGYDIDAWIGRSNGRDDEPA
jgi:DMSO/TMAO reductase YedYZ molybdopterin-dependent catalytic subunit